MNPHWRLVGDRSNGGEVGFGLRKSGDGRTVLGVSVPYASANLSPADAYRMATEILEQLRAAGFPDPS